MIHGTTLIHPGSTDKYYSPPFPKRGDAALFAVEALLLGGSPVLVVDVEHRNADETSWTVAGTLTGISVAGVTTANISGLKQMIRLSYRFSTGTLGDFVHIVVPTPAWRLY